MINRTFKNKIFSSISTTAVLLALISLSVIQYNWVTSSAEKDLTELYRSFSYRIFSAISEEFTMFPLLGERLDYLKGIENEDKLKEVMVSKYNKLNSGVDHQYINSISYLKYSDDKRYYLFYSEKGWENDRSIPEELSYERRGPSLIPDTSDNGKVWISLPIAPIGGDTKIMIIFHFDILSFYQNEVEKSLSSIGDNYELRWYYNLSDENRIIFEKDYTYSPFRVIKNQVFSIRSPWLIEIPLHVIMFNHDDDRRAKIFFETSPEEVQKKPPSVYVDIFYEGKPLIHSKEYNLTLQWLLSLLLLLGIGIAYLVILYQIDRLKQLRLREKEFVASVTHELRTPLTVIHSAADNIKSGILSPERVEQYGHLITDQSSRLSSMIEGILLFSRLEGKAEQSPQMDSVKFAEVKKDLEIFTGSIIEKTSKIIQLDFGSLPDSAVSDRDTIELILTNLITNSCKHAYNVDEEGEIRVKGHVQLPHSLIFTVEDDGIGIEKSEKKHIFDPFFRGSKSFKDQIKGSGLGLYLSFRKARLLGGTLKVESPYERADGKIRKGSRFILKIPFISNDREISK